MSNNMKDDGKVKIKLIHINICLRSAFFKSSHSAFTSQFRWSWLNLKKQEIPVCERRCGKISTGSNSPTPLANGRKFLCPPFLKELL